MTNEEFRKIMLEHMARLTQEMTSIRQDMNDMRQTMATREELAEIMQSLARIENDHGSKISALFDEQIEQLKKHLDERLDNLQFSINYSVQKSAEHDNELLRLKKIK